MRDSHARVDRPEQVNAHYMKLYRNALTFVYVHNESDDIYELFKILT
jgi:hypothetical protein